MTFRCSLEVIDDNRTVLSSASSHTDIEDGILDDNARAYRLDEIANAVRRAVLAFSACGHYGSADAITSALLAELGNDPIYVSHEPLSYIRSYGLGVRLLVIPIDKESELIMREKLKESESDGVIVLKHEDPSPAATDPKHSSPSAHTPDSSTSNTESAHPPTE